ncbi:uncharacterized protein LOC117591553 isoform X1 [Drosophila guanche]|uniref:uncharacterized protein LOC117591553 isoform X1 n=1 Tax=Drosophila guanche TaxID=7266 RepID=UPI0014713A3F|nr:uncharacterized protein LOC117591553 isoform X1 [Drosophila guanche]
MKCLDMVVAVMVGVEKAEDITLMVTDMAREVIMEADIIIIIRTCICFNRFMFNYVSFIFTL